MASKNILIVEDESIIAMDIQNTLENLGYSVPATASTGKEAMQKVAETLPDLILMDINLKNGTDGVQVAAEIRKSFNIPVVFLTAYSDEETMQRARITEPYGYLLKPFEKRELQMVIEIGLYRHKTEMALQKSQHELEERVAERTKQLEEAVKTRDEFISIASHELKTPLTTMKLQLQNLIRKSRRSLHELSPEKIQSVCQVSINQLDRLTYLVEDMLDITRIGARKLRLQKEEFDLSELAQEAIERFHPQMEEVNIVVTSHLEKGVVGNWDRFRIDQVISNLLSNAIKYAPNSPVEINLKKVGSLAVFSISDMGIGISEEAQARIFKRFERAVSVSSVSGLGLGLYISSEILAMHGGGIRVESKVGQGSKFIVELPLNSSDSTEME